MLPRVSIQTHSGARSAPAHHAGFSAANHGPDNDKGCARLHDCPEESNMEPAHDDPTGIPDVTSNLSGIAASPVPFSPGASDRQVNARMLRDREVARVRPLSALALPSRITNALLRSGVNCVGQLISRSREDLITEITGLGEGSLKIIEAALALENLALAPTETLSSAFTRTSTSRAVSSAKNNRHIKNHNTWLTPPTPTPARDESPPSTDDFQRHSVPMSAAEGPGSLRNRYVPVKSVR